MLAHLLIALVLQSPVTGVTTSPVTPPQQTAQTWFEPTLLGKGRFQAFEKDARQPENKTGFRITLLEIGARGNLSEHWSYRVKANAALEVSPLDFYAEYGAIPQIKFRVGQFKAPFGKQELSSTGELLMADRAMVAAAAPGRDIGAMAFGQWRRLAYAVGTFNGEGRNLARNINNAFLNVARLTVTPWGNRVDGGETLVPRRRGLTLGCNGGTNLHGDIQNAKETLAGADVSFYFGRFALLGEWNVVKFTPPSHAKLAPYERKGFYVQSAFLVGKRWEWVARYERYEPNTGLTAVQYQSIEGLTAGTNVHFDDGRETVFLSYGKFAELEGPALRNNTVAAQLQIRME